MSDYLQHQGKTATHLPSHFTRRCDLCCGIYADCMCTVGALESAHASVDSQATRIYSSRWYDGSPLHVNDKGNCEHVQARWNLQIMEREPCALYRGHPIGLHAIPGVSGLPAAKGTAKSTSSCTVANLTVGALVALTLHCVFYPLDVIRGRLTVQQYYNANRPLNVLVECARFIRAKEGIRAFYRGFVPSSLGICTYTEN
ncbi:hypothetical protein PsorP6_012350 [Peronosclerospora sorghi]|uniref:Uncharacterized protein n=1 Tax=Peronosclerospora sorghi TaxID=230839 RepID=A0ACC0WG54_9STRA|nr:hypothetical protein PsorP6_012350 [Peronosclerospora sorghi]